MRGKYDLDFSEIDALKLWFMGGILAIEDSAYFDSLDLTVFNLSPEQVCQMLEHLGYEETSHESNGWEQNTYYYYRHKERKELCFFYSGLFGIMSLSLME